LSPYRRATGIKPRVACWGIQHLARFLEEVQDDRLFALWWLVGLRGRSPAAQDLELSATEIERLPRSFWDGRDLA